MFSSVCPYTGLEKRSAHIPLQPRYDITCYQRSAFDPDATGLQIRLIRRQVLPGKFVVYIRYAVDATSGAAIIPETRLIIMSASVPAWVFVPRRKHLNYRNKRTCILLTGYFQ